MFQLDYQENGFYTGRLCLNESRWFSRTTARPTVVSIVPAFAKDRQAVEDFIIGVYAKSYGAQIGVRYPVLMSVRDDTGKILAALGFRYAIQEPLFLEQYLPKPIEQVLDTPRSSITEVGNLASAGGGASLFVFAALSAYLHSKNQQYAVITSTDFLEKRFRDMGLKPKRLADADPALLLKKNENWGSYYEARPRVLSGQVDQGYKRLQSVLGAQYTENTPYLISRLHYKDERS
jgi:hypothetical protein